MYTYTGVEVAGTEVESYRNHHDTWFFRQGDRIRENCQRDEGGDFTDEEFIGYRASAASIRKRMALSDIDMPACEQHFSEYLQTVTSNRFRIMKTGCWGQMMINPCVNTLPALPASIGRCLK